MSHETPNDIIRRENIQHMNVNIFFCDPNSTWDESIAFNGKEDDEEETDDAIALADAIGNWVQDILIDSNISTGFSGRVIFSADRLDGDQWKFDYTKVVTEPEQPDEMVHAIDLESLFNNGFLNIPLTPLSDVEMK